MEVLKSGYKISVGLAAVGIVILCRPGRSRDATKSALLSRVSSQIDDVSNQRDGQQKVQIEAGDPFGLSR